MRELRHNFAWPFYLVILRILISQFYGGFYQVGKSIIKKERISNLISWMKGILGFNCSHKQTFNKPA
ncbi:MAG: hypothetical protein ACJ0BM_02650, partial [bacterium]